MRGGSGATVPASSSGGASAKGKFPTKRMKTFRLQWDILYCKNGIDIYRY